MVQKVLMDKAMIMHIVQIIRHGQSIHSMANIVKNAKPLHALKVNILLGHIIIVVVITLMIVLGVKLLAV
jgi:hypothetical protein